MRTTLALLLALVIPLSACGVRDSSSSDNDVDTGLDASSKDGNAGLDASSKDGVTCIVDMCGVCGEPCESPGAVTVSPEGGEFVNDFGIRFRVPAGAVDVPTQIEVSPLSAEEQEQELPEDIREVVLLALRGSPDGHTFNVPIELFLPRELFGQSLDPAARDALLGLSVQKGSIEFESGTRVVRESDAGVTLEVTHFSLLAVASILASVSAGYITGAGARLCWSLHDANERWQNGRCDSAAKHPGEACCKEVESVTRMFRVGVWVGSLAGKPSWLDRELYEIWHKGTGRQYTKAAPYPFDSARTRRDFTNDEQGLLNRVKTELCCDPVTATATAQEETAKFEFSKAESRMLHESRIRLKEWSEQCGGEFLDESRSVVLQKPGFFIRDEMDWTGTTFKIPCPGAPSNSIKLPEKLFDQLDLCTGNAKGIDFYVRTDWPGEPHTINVDGRLVPGVNGCECTYDANEADILLQLRQVPGEPRSCECPVDQTMTPTTWAPAEKRCVCSDGALPSGQAEGGSVTCCPVGGVPDLQHEQCVCSDIETPAIDEDGDGVADTCPASSGGSGGSGGSDGSGGSGGSDGSDGSDGSTYTLNVGTLGAGKLHIAIDGVLSTYSSYNGVHEEGTSVSVEPLPARGAEFLGWVEDDPNGQLWSHVSTAADFSDCPSGSSYIPGQNSCECTGGRSLVDSACVCPDSGPPLNEEGTACECNIADQEWNGTACVCPDSGPPLNEEGTACKCPGFWEWDGAQCACPPDGLPDNNCCPTHTTAYTPPNGVPQCYPNIYSLHTWVDGPSDPANPLELYYDGALVLEQQGTVYILPTPGEHELVLRYEYAAFNVPIVIFPTTATSLFDFVILSREGVYSGAQRAGDDIYVVPSPHTSPGFDWRIRFRSSNREKP